MKTGNLIFKIEVLDSSEMIDEACALLYRVYIEHMKWQFSPNTPSLLRVEEKNGRKLLVDGFTATARWFGVFDGDQLIGCARLHGVDDTGYYEIEGYESSECIRSYLPEHCFYDDYAPRDKCLEMGKVAVDPDYHVHRVVNQIYLGVFEYCQRNRYSVFGGVANQYIKNLFQRVKLLPRVAHAFKYEESDSCPVSFYFIDYEKGEFKPIIANLRDTLCPTKSIQSVIEALEIVAPLLPVPAYWMDTQGQVLGANDLCLKGMGADRSQVIGKKPSDFYPIETAEYIQRHNELVMRNEEIGEQNETINHLQTGEKVYAKALKVPLYDDNGHVIGIIGTSVDLTAEKEAEQLRLERQQTLSLLQQKEVFVKIARQFAHDIASPLNILQRLAPMFTDAPQKQQELFQQALQRLLGISESLLKIYRNEEDPSSWKEEKEAICLISVVHEICEEKRLQYPCIQFKCEFHQDVSTHTIVIQPTQFKRALSNLLNNAVDAVKDKPDAQITVLIDVQADKTVLSIHDNGVGMPEHVKHRLLNGDCITSGKEKGNGIGMQQVWDLLRENNGKIEIESESEVGTNIVIYLCQN